MDRVVVDWIRHWQNLSMAWFVDLQGRKEEWLSIGGSDVVFGKYQGICQA